MKQQIISQQRQSDNSIYNDQGAAFIWMWSVFCLFHIARRISETEMSNPGFIYITATLLSVVCILNPRQMQVFMLSVLLGIGATLETMPLDSNHTIMRIFLMAGMFVSLLHILVKQRHLMRITPGDFYASFAPYGKAMLVILYFYGVFHKLNLDFLNPETSCAVMLWVHYPFPPGLSDALWAHYVAIYGTLVIEMAIVVLLFIPRLKYVGLLVGLGFHFFLGLNGYRFFVAFSSMVYALDFLFLPADFLLRIRKGKVGAVLLKYRWIYLALVLGPLILYVGVLSFDLMSFYYTTLTFFIFVSVGVIWAVTIYARNKTTRWEDTWRGLITSNPVLILLLVLFFINGTMPYIGLKTQQNLNMFSNLYTERGQTNHVFFTAPPYLFGFQEDTVRILETNVTLFLDLRDNGLLIPYIEFRRLWSQTPMDYRKKVVLIFERNGKVERITPEVISDPDLFRPISPWLNRWFYFRYVATKRPQECNGHKLPEHRKEINKDR